MNKRKMAVDPGESRIGIAMSDLTGTISSPHSVVRHVSRAVDAAVIAQIAAENDVAEIIIGLALDVSGEQGPQARKANRFAEAVRAQTMIPVIMWDESNSTQIASETQHLLNFGQRKRHENIDAMAAAVILQAYLDNMNDRKEN
ncbi:MAG: Holliday junction resolvase RuvX [Chloroflexi bacterium]|nr:Holliday junction resolvase RuvX [Chloroflexota bacterium]